MQDGIFIAKVRIRVSGHVIMPGETVELSKKDIDFLLRKGFVKRVPAKAESNFDSAFDNSEVLEDGVAEFYTEDLLNALGNKGDIIEYAESIGLSGLAEEKNTRPELIDKVLAYIAEVEK